MSIDWEEIEARKQPGPDDIKQVVKDIKKMPGAGDQQHVSAVFNIYGAKIPATPKGSWDNAKIKPLKFKKLQATNAQLDRDNLIWHVQNPGKSKMKAPHNTHPQVILTKEGDYIIADGHHRLSALRLLGLKKEMCWLLKETDM